MWIPTESKEIKLMLLRAIVKAMDDCEGFEVPYSLAKKMSEVYKGLKEYIKQKDEE